jgi:hypothetical protein
MSKLSCRTFKTYLLALIFTAVIAQIPAAERKDDPVRWEKDIQAFEAADKTNPPPKNAILFIGSSSIKRWTTLSQEELGTAASVVRIWTIQFIISTASSLRTNRR